MKIRQIKIYKENLQLTRPYTIAFKTIDYVENGIIIITSDNGLTAYGAFNPSYEVVGETLEDAMETLSEESVEWLIGREIDNVENIVAEVQQKFAKSSASRIGLEIALYDLFTQNLGKPLVAYLGQQIKSMPTSITIGIKNVAETLIEAKEYVDRKFRILKVKLGISLEEDVERLVKLRENYGRTVDIIIDANQGYDTATLKKFYQQTSHLNILLIEQPIAAGMEDEMQRLPEEIKKFIAADESLVTSSDAVALAVPPKTCAFFNIKLMKCGGISEALKIADTGLSNNIDLMWGCNDESIISITAALHTAFSCSNTKFIDLDGSLDLASDIVRSGFILEDGMMSISGKPGLGLVPM